MIIREIKQWSSLSPYSWGLLDMLTFQILFSIYGVKVHKLLFLRGAMKYPYSIIFVFNFP
jgi:hypothetical protein